jgi:hypothetical protein
MSSLQYARVTGTHYTVSLVRFFREETRHWYVRLEKATAGGDLTVKVYDDAVAAANGTAAYAASATVVVASTQVAVPLTNNVGQAPTFPDTASLVVTLDATTSTGTELWSIDLGKKTERAVLRVLRALSAISIANGYFTNPIIERGMKQWEEVAIYPWIGCVGVGLTSVPSEIGGGSFGAGHHTEYTIRLLAHDAPPEPSEPTALFLFDDIRRALAGLYAQTPYDGPVNDGLPFFEIRFQGIENDLATTWARERSTVDLNLIVSIDETSEEITTG